MKLREEPGIALQTLLLGRPAKSEDDRRAARRSLRAQIARLERELADAFVTVSRSAIAWPSRP